MIKLKGDGPVIVVDDNSDALTIAEMVFKVSSVPNDLLLLRSGEELIEYLDDVVAGKSQMPSVVLLDISMPTLDGFETLQAIRARPDLQNLPLIIMLTASNDTGDMQRALNVGANDYQVKPFKIDDFLCFANSLLSDGNGQNGNTRSSA